MKGHEKHILSPQSINFAPSVNLGRRTSHSPACSLFNDIWASLFHDVIQYSALLVAIIYIVIRKYSNKELIRNSFLVLIGILCYVSSGFSGLLMTVLAIILMPNNYLEIILKMILKEETILFGIIVI